MPDALGVERQGDDAELVPDYLGTPAAQSLRGQAALPVGSPIVGGAAPASMGGGGTVAPTESGGAATRTGSKAGAPSDVVQRALQALKMGEKAARAVGTLGQSQPTKGGGVNQDPNAPEAQQGGQSGTPPMPSLPLGTADPLTQVSGGELALGTEGAAAAPGTEFASELGAYAPYVAAALAAAQTGPALAARAETSMPAMEQALLAGTEVFGHVAAPFTFGMSEGATAVLDPLITDMFGKPHKTKAQSAALGNRDLNTSYSTLLQDLQSAQTPEELAAAFGQIEGEGYRDNKMPYPVAQGFDVRDQAALLSAINSGDPEALSFGWQGGGSQEAVTGANTALNNAVRQQVALMKAAQAGDPQAQALMQERLAAKQARDAKAFETSGMNPEFQRLASEAMQSQWAQGYGGGGGGAGAP